VMPQGSVPPSVPASVPPPASGNGPTARK
jgi:hypothetical protein